VTAQALTLFDKLAGTEGKMLNRPARGGMRRAKSVAVKPVKAKLVVREELAKHGVDGKAAAPPERTGMVVNELQIKRVY
jgi:hypothetical protein